MNWMDALFKGIDTPTEDMKILTNHTDKIKSTYQSTSSKFNIGDPVVILSDKGKMYHSSIGCSGTVVQTDSELVKVSIDNKRNVWVNELDLSCSLIRFYGTSGAKDSYDKMKRAISSSVKIISGLSSPEEKESDWYKEMMELTINLQ